MSHQDDVFFRNFGAVLGSLIGIAIIIYIVAQFITGSESSASAFEKQAVEARIKPIGQVNTEPLKVAAATTTATSAAPAAGATADPPAVKLMKDKGYICMTCHQVDTKVVGPAYKEVGVKYKGDAKAAATLSIKVKQGGVGTWGQAPMPPNPTVTDEDLKVIIDWILSLGGDTAQAATPTTTSAAPATPVTPTVPTTAPTTSTVKAVTTEQASELMKQKGYICMTCHQVDTKLVGPSYKEVAAKYKGDGKAIDTLFAKIKQGGAGTWGAVPMPPNPTVSDEDMKTLITWILSL